MWSQPIGTNLYVIEFNSFIRDYDSYVIIWKSEDVAMRNVDSKKRARQSQSHLYSGYKGREDCMPYTLQWVSNLTHLVREIHSQR